MKPEGRRKTIPPSSFAPSLSPPSFFLSPLPSLSLPFPPALRLSPESICQEDEEEGRGGGHKEAQPDHIAQLFQQPPTSVSTALWIHARTQRLR